MADADFEAPFAYAGLDRIFHERARLGLVTSLAAQSGPLMFSDLKRLCGLTDGNLNRHLQALANAEFVAVVKDASTGRSATAYSLTELGRTRFIEYLEVLEAAVRDATSAANGVRPHVAKGRPKTA